MHLEQVAGSVLPAGDSKAVLSVAQTRVGGTDSTGQTWPWRKGIWENNSPELKLSAEGKTQRVCAEHWGGGAFIFSLRQLV